MKTETEFEVIKSDREGMAQKACWLIDILSTKTYAHTLNDTLTDPIDLTEQEEKAYNAALGFLEHEFIKGPQSPFTMTKKEIKDEQLPG